MFRRTQSVRCLATVVDKRLVDAHLERLQRLSSSVSFTLGAFSPPCCWRVERSAFHPRSRHTKRFNMRLSSSPAAAVCVAASLCLSATTIEAFFAPSAALRCASLTQGQRATRSECVNPVAVRMATMKGDALNPDQQDASRRTAPRNTAGSLLGRRRGAASAPEGESAQVMRAGGRRHRRASGFVRRGFAAVATAVIVRSAFRAQPASAIMPKLRGSTAQQKVRCVPPDMMHSSCYVPCAVSRR